VEAVHRRFRRGRQPWVRRFSPGGGRGGALHAGGGVLGRPGAPGRRSRPFFPRPRPPGLSWALGGRPAAGARPVARPGAVRLTALGRYASGLADAYEPVVAEARPVAGPLKVLANLDIVAVGTVSQADQLLLSAYAVQTGDRVWTVCAASLLAAVDTGRN